MTTAAPVAGPATAGWRPRLWARAVRGTWISHRVPLAGLAAVGLVLAVLIVVPGVRAHAADPAAAIACVGQPADAPCAAAYAALEQAHTWANLLGLALLLLPLIAGVFLGAPLVAREVESGSHRFLWTQGAGRTRFEARRLVLLAVAVAGCACVLGLLMGWLVHPLEAVGFSSHWDARLFNSTVMTLPAWTVFGFALGACTGAVVRRTVASMAATAILGGGLLLFAGNPAVGSFGSLTTRLLRIDPVVARVSTSVLGLGAGPAGVGPRLGALQKWVVQSWVTSPRGHRYFVPTVWTTVLARHPAAQRNPTRWFAAHHFSNWYSYQPGDRFWTFEGALAAGLVLAAALLCWLTVTVVRRLG